MIVTRLYRTLKYYFLRLKRLRGDSASLARGVALGTFIGITPTIPLHTALIIVLSFPFKTSKISALVSSVIVSNPLTIPFLYTFSWVIGNSLLPGALTHEKLAEVMALIRNDAGFMDILNELATLGTTALSVLVLGGCILATPFTVAFYILSLKFFRKIEMKRAAKQARNSDRD